jgi:NAD(P)-dependent dehydrogenase (short-subunit alcohol dehydrogenase family)
LVHQYQEDTMPTALITGANRGLGLEFTRQYLGDDWHVVAACRRPGDAAALADLGDHNSRLQIVAVDVCDHATIERAATEVHGRPIDLLINNAGIFGPSESTGDNEGQRFGHIDYAAWEDVLRVNSLAPMKMAEAFVTNIALGEQKKIITISSDMGSIANTGTGAHFAYRTSKAAVNMAMATLADTLSSQGIIVALLCPGWCRTDLGGSVAPHDPADSVARMRKLIAGFTLEDSGTFTRHTGERLPW